MSSDSTRLFLSDSGTSPLTMRCARPFDDGRLADAGLADQHGIVLGAPLQDLDGAADLVVAADDRIELAVARARREVDRVLGERLALAFGFLRVDLAAAAHDLDRVLERFAREAVLFQDAAGVALVLREGEQEQLARDELVAALDRFLVREIQEVVEVARDGDFAARALDLGQAVDRLLERALQARHRDAGAREERRRAAVLLRQQRGQEVLRLDEAVVVAEREALGVVECLLELGCEFVEAHGASS